MDDLKTPAETSKHQARPALGAWEVERRRAQVRMADAESRIEGITRDPATDEIFNAYVRGEIDATEIVPRLRAQLRP